MLKRFLGYLAGAMLLGGTAFAASLPLFTGPQDPSQVGGNMNAVVQAVNAGAPGFGSLPAGTRNYLDNGAMFVAQRGTGVATGASTAGCVALSYSADRWCVDTNVTSGAGRSQVITSTPSPPPGFQNSTKVYRNSGALLQPICLMQEIEAARTVQLQGKPVIFSAYVQGLAGNTATAALSVSFLTGTTADEGLGALRSAVGMTASPAITPALTGLATNAFAAAPASPTWIPGTTAAWSRIYSQPLTIPVAAIEGVLTICTTPVGSSSGTTDGFAITGVQLEVADPGQLVPTAFEFLPNGLDQARAQRFYYQVVETNGGYIAPGIASATNVQTVTLQLPQPMQNLPIIAVTAGGLSYRDNGSALAISSLVVSSASIANNTVLTLTDAATQTVGHTAPLYGTNTTGKITLSADF